MSNPPLPLTPDALSRTEAESTRALAAPVLDALWMLARQWQIGELHAEDGGAAVGLELTLDTASFEQVETPAGQIKQLTPSSAPLNLAVDAEPVPPLAARPLDELASAGLELLRTLDDLGAGAAREVFLMPRYRLAISDEQWSQLEPSSQRRLRPWRNRVPDPRLIMADLERALGPTGTGPGPLPAFSVPLPADVLTALESALRNWIRWLDPVPTTDTTDSCWLPERLESAFSLKATTTTSIVRLRAPEHLGGDLDWYSYVRSQEQVTRPVTLPQQRFLPAPIRYPGMPLPRFWELEDGNVNLDFVALGSDDVGAMALLAFVHQHADDWFSVPVELPTGSITVVHSVTVVTSFGERFAIPAAAELDGTDTPFQLFAVSLDPEASGGSLNPASPLVLSHSAGRHLTGPALEDLLLVRDEMANLAWAVELVTRDPSGQPVDRFARYQRLRPPSPAGGAKGSRYRLGSAAPDYWYPMESATGPDGRPVLRLAAIPSAAVGVSDIGIQGTILNHNANIAVHDEEVPREGVRVVRRWHHARWTDGTTHVWMARTKRPAQGGGSSGLRFDYLE